MFFFCFWRGRFGVGKAKAQKRSEAWQLGSRFVWMTWGGTGQVSGGDGSGWGLDRTPWPWKVTWKMLGENHSFITLFVFFLKFQPVMLAFTIVFLLTPFVPR